MKLCLKINNNKDLRRCSLYSYNYLVVDYFDLSTEEYGLEKVDFSNSHEYFGVDNGVLPVVPLKYYQIGDLLDYVETLESRVSKLQGNDYRFFDINENFLGVKMSNRYPKYYNIAKVSTDGILDYLNVLIFIGEVIFKKWENFYKFDGDYLLVKCNPYTIRLRVLDKVKLSKLILF